MTCDVHCPVNAEIMTVDSQSDLRILLLIVIIKCKIFLNQVEGFYANKKKARTKKFLLDWSQKASEKATG